MAIKTSPGRADFSIDPGLFQRALLAEGLVELAITAPRLWREGSVPWVHRYPFDRLLVAQAPEEGLTLLAADATLKRYGSFVTVV